MNNDKTKMFEDFGWSSKVITDGFPQRTNILVPDNNIHNTINGVVFVIVEHGIEINDKSLVYLDDTLFDIENIDEDDDGDFILQLNKHIDDDN